MKRSLIWMDLMDLRTIGTICVPKKRFLVSANLAEALWWYGKPLATWIRCHCQLFQPEWTQYNIRRWSALISGLWLRMRRRMMAVSARQRANLCGQVNFGFRDFKQRGIHLFNNRPAKIRPGQNSITVQQSTSSNHRLTWCQRQVDQILIKISSKNVICLLKTVSAAKISSRIFDIKNLNNLKKPRN